MGDYYSGPRTFEMLSDSEKVKAMLTTIREPVSKTLALEFAGIDPNRADQFESIFTGNDVVKSGSEQEPKFVLSAAAKENMGDIDWQSIHKKLTNDLWNSWYGEVEI